MPSGCLGLAVADKVAKGIGWDSQPRSHLWELTLLAERGIPKVVRLSRLSKVSGLAHLELRACAPRGFSLCDPRRWPQERSQATCFSDTQWKRLRATASAATASHASGRTFERDLALADAKQMEPANVVNRLRVTVWASEVWQPTLPKGLLALAFSDAMILCTVEQPWSRVCGPVRGRQWCAALSPRARISGEPF